MNKVIPTIFIIVGSIIGAGFASGREISLFFAEFGYGSLYFLPIVFFLFYYSFKLFLTLGAKFKFQNVLEINKNMNSSIFFNIATVGIFIIYGAAMFSCSVEIVSSTFIQVPVGLIYLIIFAICILVLQFGFKGLVKINAVLIPIIVALIVVYSVYSLINPVTNATYIPQSSGVYKLPFSIIIYVFVNILLSCFILTQAGSGLTKHQIIKISFGASLVICLVIAVCILCLISNGSAVMDASMPFVALTLRLGEPFPIIYRIILFLGVLTSLFGCLHTINNCFNNKFGKKTSIICGVLIVMLSVLGFKNIVNNFYPIIGLFGIALIIKIYLSKKFNTYFKQIY